MFRSVHEWIDAAVEHSVDFDDNNCRHGSSIRKRHFADWKISVFRLWFGNVMGNGFHCQKHLSQWKERKGLSERWNEQSNSNSSSTLCRLWSIRRSHVCHPHRIIHDSAWMIAVMLSPNAICIWTSSRLACHIHHSIEGKAFLVRFTYELNHFHSSTNPVGWQRCTINHPVEYILCNMIRPCRMILPNWSPTFA